MASSQSLLADSLKEGTMKRAFLSAGLILVAIVSLALAGCGGTAAPVAVAPTAGPTASDLLAPTDIPPTAPLATVTPLPTAAPPTATPEPTAVQLVDTCDASQAAWIGSFGFGLNCLDAARWHLYTEEDSPISNQLMDAAICPDGRAWVLHSFHLDATDGRSWESFRNAWGYGSPATVACDGGSGVWVAHFEGLSHYDGSQWVTYEAVQLGTGQNVRLVKDVALAPDGQVWAVTANSVASFDGQAWTVYETGTPFEKDYYFEQVAVDPQGQVWAAHSSGVWQFDGTSWTPHEGRHLSQVQSLVVDSQGQVWAGTYARGASVFDGRSWTTYTRENSGLSSNNVGSLAADARGRIWLGTEWGLNVLDGQTWQVYHMHTSGLPDNDIHALAVGGTGPELPAALERAPGSLSGTIVRGTESLSGAEVQACAEYIGRLFSGPSPCADMAFYASTVTGEDGSFLFSGLPVGRYGLALQVGEGEWVRLTEGPALGDRQVLVQEGQETDVGTLDVSE
jgi:hypothetical protein